MNVQGWGQSGEPIENDIGNSGHKNKSQTKTGISS